MSFEIERKYLVTSDEFKEGAASVEISQAYLTIEENLAIRVRIEGLQASIAVKSKVSERVNREYEYNIPIDEARSMMKLSLYPAIIRTRFVLDYGRHAWEVDAFQGENTGLIVAEIELDDENEVFEKPPWLGEEVTADYRYLNSNLSRTPFKDW